jgi:hypothetical protein
MTRHAVGKDAVAFNVVDRESGTSAKGDFVGTWGGAVLPLLEWTHTHTAADARSPAVAD